MTLVYSERTVTEFISNLTPFSLLSALTQETAIWDGHLTLVDVSKFLTTRCSEWVLLFNLRDPHHRLTRDRLNKEERKFKT